MADSPCPFFSLALLVPDTDETTPPEIGNQPSRKEFIKKNLKYPVTLYLKCFKELLKNLFDAFFASIKSNQVKNKTRHG